ncbi:MAG: HEAT repeat domain-containing protein [Candidatus Neomarinimicrobiota bacterium]|tara:strand:- start:127 stop:1008 length:882 start_codon:yes stop_codon:yes gene_type:complete
MNNTTAIENQKEDSSRIYTLFYSFFLIPFMIAIFGAIFFLLFRFITYETNDASELLNQVKIGSATKRWQSAYELSKVLNNPETIPEDISFKNQMVSAYDHSINDDPLVRAYLAIAMGATGDQFYAEELVNGLEDESRESRLAAIQAVGMVRSELAVVQLIDIINNSDYQDERLAATMSLGFIGDSRAIPKLNELLEDDEPNIRWDSAIALAKMGEESSVPIIENLMDREYLMTFPELDYKEINKVIMTAIETSSIVLDNRFEPRLVELARSDENLTVRDAAIKTLRKSYDRII